MSAAAREIRKTASPLRFRQAAIRMKIVSKILWKTPVVVGALVVGTAAANQAGWSGAELIASRGSADITDLFFSVGAGVSISTVILFKELLNLSCGQDRTDR
jgi:hypothetical protein